MRGDCDFYMEKNGRYCHGSFVMHILSGGEASGISAGTGERIQKKAAAAAENLARGENVFRQGREETPQEYRLETVECCKIETRQQRQLKRDKKILQRIVEAEAGDQDIRGRRLVANVILNRVRSSKFPDTIREVVFAARQFSPVSDGRYYTVQVSEKTVEAVEQALKGVDDSRGALYFMWREGADSSNASWFDRDLQKLFTHGCHEFFR